MYIKGPLLAFCWLKTQTYNWHNSLETESSKIFSLLDAIHFILCGILNLKCERYHLPTNLFNTSFQNRTEIYPEILMFHILQDHPNNGLF